MSQVLQPLVLKVAHPTNHHFGNVIKNPKVWYIWSNNEDEQTYTCLPYRTIGDDYQSLFIYDLVTFRYDEVEIHEIDYLEAIDKFTVKPLGVVIDKLLKQHSELDAEIVALKAEAHSLDLTAIDKNTTKSEENTSGYSWPWQK